MSQNYVIGPGGPIGSANGAAIYEPNRKHPACVIVNIGDTTVFVSDTDPLGDPSQGMPLGPGSSVPWDADLPLYTVCPTRGELTIVGNSGIPFSADAIAVAIVDQGLAADIATAVEESGLSSSIAASIVGSGLAGSIASNILASGLATDIAEQIYVTGVPPVDKYTLLKTTNTTGTAWNSGLIDTSPYQSINISGSNGFPARLLAGCVTVAWYTDTATGPSSPTNGLLGTDTFYIGSGAYSSVTLAVRGARCVIYVEGTSGSTALQVYGSYKVTAPRYFGAGSGSTSGEVTGQAVGPIGVGNTGTSTWSGSIAAGTSWTWQPDVTAGPATMSLRFTSVSQFSMLLRSPNNIYPLTTFASESNRTSAVGLQVDYRFTAPAMPVELSLSNVHATAALTFRATLTYETPF